MAPRLVLLSGGRGAGKTTVCRETVDLAQGRGYRCRGLVTVRRGDGTLDVLDLDSGDSRQLTVDPSSGDAVRQGAYHFDPQTLCWGNEVLAAALPCDLLVIDELGPLEIVRGQGWSNALDVLQRPDFSLALTVVRPELLAVVQPKLAPVATTVLTVTAESRPQLPEVIVAMLRMQAEAPGDS